MTSKPILILGGYGNLGLAIARLLVKQAKVEMILAGRNGKHAAFIAEQLNAEFETDCFSGMQVDTADKGSLIQAFKNIQMVVVASSTKGINLMNRPAIGLGTWGAALGMLAGLIETTFGASIRPWIGNKENPFILGLVTMLLSGLAWVAVRMAQKRVPSTADGKLATILGVLVPAGVCFTTVGMLWYLPGILLLVSACLLLADFGREYRRITTEPWGWVSGWGALISLLSFGAAFWCDAFGLFSEMLPARTDRLLIQILPMDFLRRTVYAFGAVRVETLESSTVMVVYILLALGAVISLLASLASSPLFAKVGGGISLSGMLFFLWKLPAVLMQANFQSASPLWTSLGWGWYLSMLGTALILLGAF